jgi:hypothetical protein
MKALCYCIQNLLSCSLLFESIKIKYKQSFTIIVSLDISIIPFLFKTCRVLENRLYLCLQVELLCWAQSIELVPISEHQHHHKIGYIN